MAAARKYASLLYAIHRKEHPVLDSFPQEIRPKSIEEAYNIQDEFLQLSKWKTCGWKIGATNLETLQKYGCKEPFYGRLFEHTTHISPVGLVKNMHFLNFRGVEPEITVVMKNDLKIKEGNEPFNIEEVKAAVLLAKPSLELLDIQSREEDRNVCDAIAQNAGHGRLVVAPNTTFLKNSFPHFDLADFPVELQLNTTAMLQNPNAFSVVEKGNSKNVMGNPLYAVLWLANALAKRNIHLKRGEMICTGTTTKVYVPPPGVCLLLAKFGSMGSVELMLQEDSPQTESPTKSQEPKNT